MGGSVRAVLTGERVNDTDLFFSSAQVYKEFEDRMLARHDVECIRYTGEGRAGTPFIQVIRKSDDHVYDACNWMYGSIEQHIEYNDWLHTAIACDMRGNAIIRRDVLEAIQRRELIPGKSTFAPAFHLTHMFRFMSEGWSVSNEVYAEKVGAKLPMGVQEVP
jgi:hypothetical protein